MSDEPDPTRLHPAEHRAYRELYVACRQLINRWGRLRTALDGSPLSETLAEASRRVQDLLVALEPRTAAFDLHAGPMAHGLGARIADLRGAIGDRTVDTGMVMRFAVLDIEHIATLLAHLRELARARGDYELAGFCDEWASEMRTEVKQVRKAAVRLGRDPDRAAAPLDDSPLGRAAHGLGWVFGSVGEALDRITATGRDGES
jgi:hypothetical protein